MTLRLSKLFEDQLKKEFESLPSNLNRFTCDRQSALRRNCVAPHTQTQPDANGTLSKCASAPSMGDESGDSTSGESASSGNEWSESESNHASDNYDPAEEQPSDEGNDAD